MAKKSKVAVRKINNQTSAANSEKKESIAVNNVQNENAVKESEVKENEVKAEVKDVKADEPTDFEAKTDGGNKTTEQYTETVMEKKAENKKEASRECVIKRETRETNITLGLRLDGDGNADINTGIGFFDHMLEGFARHGNFDLKIIEKGDLNVDCHHTVEDLGIVLGQAIAKLTEDKTGLNRYASFIQPMDDALVLVSVDLCSRAYLNFNYEFTKERVGYFETETLKEFFRAVADQAGMNIHIKVLDGDNTHHIIEATFKGFANALNIATSKDGRKGVLSTKGTL